MRKSLVEETVYQMRDSLNSDLNSIQSRVITPALQKIIEEKTLLLEDVEYVIHLYETYYKLDHIQLWAIGVMLDKPFREKAIQGPVNDNKPEK